MALGLNKRDLEGAWLNKRDLHRPWLVLGLQFNSCMDVRIFQYSTHQMNVK